MYTTHSIAPNHVISREHVLLVQKAIFNKQIMNQQKYTTYGIRAQTTAVEKSSCFMLLFPAPIFVFRKPTKTTMYTDRTRKHKRIQCEVCGKCIKHMDIILQTPGYTDCCSSATCRTTAAEGVKAMNVTLDNRVPVKLK